MSITFLQLKVYEYSYCVRSIIRKLKILFFRKLKMSTCATVILLIIKIVSFNCHGIGNLTDTTKTLTAKLKLACFKRRDSNHINLEHHLKLVLNFIHLT